MERAATCSANIVAKLKPSKNECPVVWPLDGYGFRVAKAKLLVANSRAKLQKIRNRKPAA